MRRPHLYRHGTATVVAMIFMVILVALAAGVGATAMSSIQVSRNEQSIQQSLAAAESGMQVIKSFLTRAKLAGTVTPGDAMQPLYYALYDIAPETFVAEGSPKPLLIKMGSAAAPVRLHPSPNNAGFYAVLYPSTARDPNVMDIVAQVVGTDGITGTRRALYALFRQTASTPVPYMFGYGMYSRGGIYGAGGAQIRGDYLLASVRSTLATSSTQRSIILDGNVVSDGGAMVRDSSSQAQIGNNIRLGASLMSDTEWGLLSNSQQRQWNASHTKVEPAPAEPTFNPNFFSPYATGPQVSATQPFPAAGGKNIRIKAGTGTTASPLTINVNSSTLLEGIVYIESPNNVVFTGSGGRFNCAFIVEGSGTTGSVTDTLSFSGNNTFVPLAPSDIAAGYAILAPRANLSLAGGTQYDGNVIGWKIRLTGGTELNINNGSVISYDQTPASTNVGGTVIDGNTIVRFRRDGRYLAPTNGMNGGDLAPPANRWYVFAPSLGYEERPLE